MKSEFQEPRTRTIFRVVEEYLGSTSDSFQTFTMHVTEDYEANVNPKNIEFSKHEDAYKRIELNAQKIKRFMSKETGSPRFPAELEESMVAALPDEYRLPLLSKLAARYGLIATPMPSGEANHTTDFARLLEKVGTAVQAMAPILADGKVCAKDLPHIAAAQDELTELLAAAYGQFERLESVKKVRAVG